MVDVSTQNNSVSVNVSTGGTSASIKATPDMAQYYSEKSREWAISNRIVENIDYSSKYYAEKSKESATSALSSVEQAKSVKEQAIEEINSLKDVATNEIQDIAINATSDVTDVKIEAISNIQTSTYEAIEQIEQEGLEQFNKVKSTGFYMRDDKLYFINSKGEEEEFKSGGSSSESGAGMPVGTFFTLNCKDSYIPENCLVRDGTEYSKWQFENFWKDYLTSEEKTWQINKNADYSAELEFSNGIMSGVGEFNFKISNTDDEIVYKFLVNDLNLMQTLINFGKNELGILYGNTTQNIPYFGLGTGVKYFELTTNEFYVKFSRHESFSTGWFVSLSYDNKTWQTYDTFLNDGLEDILTKITFNNQFSVDLINSYIVNNNIITYLAEERTESILNTCSYADYENELKTYGFCNKFAVNDISETFRVPTAKKIERFLIDKKEATETDSTWFNLYSDGYCEQGGIVAGGSSTDTVHLPHPYKDINYKVLITNNKTSSVGNYAPIYDITTNSTFIIYSNGDGTKGCNKCWHTTGYADISAYELPKEFVVVATGQINESQYNWDDLVNGLNKVFDGTEINTPFFYGMSQYFENEPNNLSWLKSSGQYYSKIVHTGYYNWLLNIYNSGVQNGKVTVKAHTDTTITDYDFIINIENETFRLPLKNGEESLPSSVFESMTLGATDTNYIAQSNGWVCVCKVVKASGQYIQIVAPSGTEPAKASTSSDWLYATKEVKRGDKYKIQYTAAGETKFFRFNHAVGNGDLYYFVGETVNNTNLINAGRIEEQVSNLVTVVDSYRNEASGYNIYSNGYCEQWGIVKKGSGISAGGSWAVDITLLKPYINSEYVIDLTAGYGVSTSASAGEESYYKAKTKTSFNLNLYNRNSGTAMQSDIELSWKTSGYLY